MVLWGCKNSIHIWTKLNPAGVYWHIFNQILCLCLCRNGSVHRAVAFVIAASVGNEMDAAPLAFCFLWHSTMASPMFTPILPGVTPHTSLWLLACFLNACCNMASLNFKAEGFVFLAKILFYILLQPSQQNKGWRWVCRWGVGWLLLTTRGRPYSLHIWKLLV